MHYKAFVQNFAAAFGVLVVGGIGIVLGYLASDMLYAVGLWPMGASLRVGLLGAFPVLIIGFLVLLWNAFASLRTESASWAKVPTSSRRV